jgi:hypothetical protein
MSTLVIPKNHDSDHPTIAATVEFDSAFLDLRDLGTSMGIEMSTERCAEDGCQQDHQMATLAVYTDDGEIVNLHMTSETAAHISVMLSNALMVTDPRAMECAVDCVSKSNVAEQMRAVMGEGEPS